MREFLKRLLFSSHNPGAIARIEAIADQVGVRADIDGMVTAKELALAVHFLRTTANEYDKVDSELESDIQRLEEVFSKEIKSLFKEQSSLYL